MVRCGPFWPPKGSPSKKSLHASEQERPDVARKRLRWTRYQKLVDPARLVFIDETWAKTNMTRTHGRAMRGQRLVAGVPHGHWTTMTFLAALRSDRITAPCVIDGPINGTIFLAWVTQFLVPTLKSGDVVILDNLGSTKGWPSAVPSGRQGRTCCFCPPTARTLTRSRWCSPNSRRCCERPTSDQSPPSGTASATCSTASLPPNAPTTSGMPDTLQRKLITL